MKKGKTTMIVTIFIISMILACVIFMQFKIVNETNIEQIESMRKDELEETLASWKEKYEETYQKLEDTNKKITEYEKRVRDNQEIGELVKKELKEAQKDFGLTDVTGDGIIVTLTDKKEKSIEAEDLLDLINELKEAGSEAISINNNRITNLTDIVDISSKYIKINSDKITSPYVIKAIGDKTYLKSALTIKNGYYDLKQKEGCNIQIEEKNNIQVNKYSHRINVRYIEL